MKKKCKINSRLWCQCDQRESIYDKCPLQTAEKQSRLLLHTVSVFFFYSEYQQRRSYTISVLQTEDWSAWLDISLSTNDSSPSYANIFFVFNQIKYFSFVILLMHLLFSIIILKIKLQKEKHVSFSFWLFYKNNNYTKCSDPILYDLKGFKKKKKTSISRARFSSLIDSTATGSSTPYPHESLFVPHGSKLEKTSWLPSDLNKITYEWLI